MYNTSIILSVERQYNAVLSWSSSLDDDNELLNLFMQWWKEEPKNYDGREHPPYSHFWVFLPIKKKYVKDGTATLTFVYLYFGQYKPLSDWCYKFLPAPKHVSNSVLAAQ